MSKSAIIFDLDGTLLDTLDDLADSMNEALAELGFPCHPTDAYRRFVGNGVRMLAKRALPDDARDDKTADRLLGVYNSAYRKNCCSKTRPYSGVPELLSELRRRDVSLFILSNKPEDFTADMVKRYFGDIFTEVLGNSERFPTKPAPDAALHLIEKYGIIKEHVLFVGDSDADMMTAVNAGIDGAGVLWGFRDEPELRNSGAAFIVTKPPEILDLI